MSLPIITMALPSHGSRVQVHPSWVVQEPPQGETNIKSAPRPVVIPGDLAKANAKTSEETDIQPRSHESPTGKAFWKERLRAPDNQTPGHSHPPQWGAADLTFFSSRTLSASLWQNFHFPHLASLPPFFPHTHSSNQRWCPIYTIMRDMQRTPGTVLLSSSLRSTKESRF